MEATVDDLSVSDNKNLKKVTRTTFIQNGHIAFKEERFLAQNHKQVAQAIIKFREWRAAFEAEHSDVFASDIPEHFTDLIALLAHESEETLTNLADRINDILRPFKYNAALYRQFCSAIKLIITTTTVHCVYGLSYIKFLKDATPHISNIPKRLKLFRWEAEETSKFPLEIRQAVVERRERRVLFSRNFADAFRRLSENDRIKLLNDKNGNFIALSATARREEQKEESLQQTGNNNKTIFDTFKHNDYTSLSPLVKKSCKRLCSSFDTLVHVGLNDSFDLRQRFLNNLPSSAKKERAVNKNVHIDMRKAWLDSTTISRDHEKHFYNSETYKNIRSLKMKLLYFHEDVRPAYYGTWSKAVNGRNIVNGRRPFAKDTQILNYNYDSEAEWDHDVDGDDIHTLDPDEDDGDDDDMLLLESTDEDDNGIINDEEGEDEIKWVVSEGYLFDDEGFHDKKKPFVINNNQSRIVSRPAKWPISGSKHFPMKSVILGPSFESMGEPDNHPLSDFKIHMFVDLEKPDDLGYSPFNKATEPHSSILNNTKEQELLKSTPLPVYFESNKPRPPLFQREIDKIVNSYREELTNIILENKTKTMMGLVIVLKSRKSFSEFTTAQLQSMIHDIAIQEIRDTNTEYNWYIRAASPSQCQ